MPITKKKASSTKKTKKAPVKAPVKKAAKKTKAPAPKSSVVRRVHTITVLNELGDTFTIKARILATVPLQEVRSMIETGLTGGATRRRLRLLKQR